MATEQYDGQVSLYVGTFTNDPDEGIYHFRMDLSTGALEAAGVTKQAYSPFSLAIGDHGQRLYATNSVDETDTGPEGTVSAFSIDAETGGLTFLNRQPSGGVFPCYVTLDRTGRHLLVGNYKSGSVAVLPIASDGRLRPASDVVQHEGSSVNQERQDGPHVHSVVLGSAGRYAFAADLGIDKVLIYRVDPEDGRLTPGEPASAGVVAGAGPRHLTFHPGGRYAYLLNELDSTVTLFDFDHNAGSLTEVQSISALPPGYSGENFAADVQVMPSGDFLYTTNRGHDSIAVFAIDQDTGRLTAVAYEPAGGAWPWNLAIDLTARFLLSANQDSNNVVVFRIDQETGRLTATGHEAHVPKPVCVEFVVRE